MLATLHLLAVYAGTVAATLWWVHRGFRPLSRRSALALALLPMALPGTALLTGRVYAPMDLLFEHPPWQGKEDELGVTIRPSIAGDLPFQIVPWHAAVRDAWAGGDWPLWNPTLLGGDILAASAQPAPYHPLNLLSLLLPLDLSLTYQAAAILFLAALGAYLYARELGCGEGASLVGAATWAFSGFLVFWLLWPMGVAVATLPLLTTGVRRLCRGNASDEVDSRPGSAWLLGVAFALLFLSGHPESMLHVATAGALYGLAELVALRPGWRRVATLACRATLAAALAGAIAAIHLLPILDALPETYQYELRRATFGEIDHSVPWTIARERVLTAVLPFRYGVSWKVQGIPTSGFFVPMSQGYVGSVALALALFGLLRHPSRARWPLAAVAAFGVLAGAAAPIVTEILAAPPIFELSIHRRWVFVACWALSTLAALGADAWIRRNPKDAWHQSRGATKDAWHLDDARKDAWHLAAIFGLVTLGAAALVAENWTEMTHPPIGDGLPVEHLVWGACWLLVAPALVAIGLAVDQALAARRGRIADGPTWRGAILAMVLAALVVQRAGEAGDRYPTLDRDAFAPEPPILAEIPRSTDGTSPSRFVGVGWHLVPNTSAYYGLEDVRGYQPMARKRYVQTYRYWDTAPEIFFNEVDDLSPRFLDLLGVRWAVAPRDHAQPERWRVRAEVGSSKLLENVDALPRAFVPRRVRLDDPKMLEYLQLVEDFRDVAFVETGVDNPEPPRFFDNGPGTVEVTRDGTGLRLDIDLGGLAEGEEAWVVVTEPNWEGWRAWSRGEELTLYRAHHAFWAMRLPTGRHEVEMRFLPTSFVVGRAVSFAALAFVLLWFAVALGRRRSLELTGAEA